MLPCSDVPVAFEVAEGLHALLDVIVVRKLGVPFQPEYGNPAAVGALPTIIQFDRPRGYRFVAL